MSLPNIKNEQSPPIDEEEIVAAMRDLIAYTGDDPDREGLRDTPERLAKALKDIYAGYQGDGAALLKAVRFPTPDSPIVLKLKDIPFSSYCEHHILPIIGHITVEISFDQWAINSESLNELVEIYARRLQIQEKLNAQIFNDIETVLQPLGCMVTIKSVHFCMAMRGVNLTSSNMLTQHCSGIYTQNAQ